MDCYLISYFIEDQRETKDVFRKYHEVSKAAQASRVGSYELVFSLVNWLLLEIDLTI